MQALTDGHGESAEARTNSQLAELGFAVGDVVEDRYGVIREVVGVEHQGGSRKVAIKVRSEDGSVRRLMPNTLTKVDEKLVFLGEDLYTVRLSFPTADSAAGAAQALRDLGSTLAEAVSPQEWPGDEWLVNGTLMRDWDDPDWHTQIESLAQRFGGTYDGGDFSISAEEAAELGIEYVPASNFEAEQKVIDAAGSINGTEEPVTGT